MLKAAKTLKEIKENENSGGGDFFDNSIKERELTRAMNKGDKVRLRFLQELDVDSPLYNEEYGTGMVIDEYEHPDYYWFSVADVETDDGSPSWLARQAANSQENLRWKLKRNLYINVAVLRDNGEAEVFYISRGAYGKGLGADIVNSADARGKLTDTIWTLAKVSTGSQAKDVEYKLTMIDPTTDPLPVDADDLIDLTETVRVFEADEQQKEVEDFNRRMAARDSNGSTNSAPAATSTTDVPDW